MVKLSWRYLPAILRTVKKIDSEKDILRLLVLAILVTYLYYPFFSASNMGAYDARWYQYILHDALVQVDQGLFPSYVGQSIFSFFGGPIVRAPYYILLGQFLHLISFGQLSALLIQHLTIIFSAFLGAFFCFFLFTRLEPKHRWWAVFFSFLYVSCPGVMGLIYGCDAYNAFMTVPFIPLAIYGLIRTQQKQDALSYFLTAAALSLTWMGHPPIGLWLTIICMFFYLIRLVIVRKGLLAFPLVIFLLIVFSLWQFVNVFNLKLGGEYAGRMQDYATVVVFSLKSDLPGAFLPLKWGKGSSPFIQLGYTLIFILFLSVTTTFRMKNCFVKYGLLSCVVLLLLLLYPLPYIGHFLWSLVPQFISNITFVWPQQRFYIIIAALLCFIGLLTIKYIYSFSNTFIIRTITLLCFLLVFWNLYEAYFFIDMAQTRKRTGTWDQSENIFFIPYHILPIHTTLFSGAYDPQLKTKLLDKQLLPIAGYDNEELVIKNCFSHRKISGDKIYPVNSNFTLPIQISSPEYTNFKEALHLKSVPAKWKVLCLKVKSDKDTSFTIEILNSHDFSDYTTNTQEKILTIPIYSQGQENQIQTLFFRKNEAAGKIVIEDYGITNYNPEQLPIRVLSFTPYIGEVETKSDNNYLQIFKEYHPGYRAKVNNQNVEVLATKDLLVLVPLKNKGINRVELTYVGTASMSAAFYLCSISWISFGVYLIILVRRKMR